MSKVVYFCGYYVKIVVKCDVFLWFSLMEILWKFRLAVCGIFASFVEFWLFWMEIQDLKVEALLQLIWDSPRSFRIEMQFFSNKHCSLPVISSRSVVKYTIVQVQWEFK